MINNKLRQLLKEKNKSVYGLAKFLGVTQQNANYLVKNMDLKRDYDRIKKIAQYLDSDIEDVIDD